MKTSGDMFHQINHEITRIQDKNGLLVFCNTDGDNYVKDNKKPMGHISPEKTDQINKREK